MKMGVVVVVILGGLLGGWLLWHPQRSRPTATPAATVVPAQGQTTPSTASLALALPFDLASLPQPPKSFGLYPFGLKSSEHPEGHAGLNIEASPTTAILAPAAMKITALNSPTGRNDEHNIEADQVGGNLKFEYLRVGRLAAGVQVGAVIGAGQTVANPGQNHTLGVWMFHFGLLDDQKNAICPAKSYWQPAAWQTLTQLLAHSKDDHGQPYSAICLSTTPIPFAARTFE